MSWKTRVSGHCACGACTYTIDPTTPSDPEFLKLLISHWGAPYEVINDHCDNCRRAMSSLFVQWLIFPIEWLQWTGDTQQHLKTWSRESENHGTVQRKFCGNCGTSFTYWRNKRVELIDVALGTLCEEDLARAPELGLKPTEHSWWAWGVKWVQETIRDGLPAYKNGYTKEEEKVEGKQ